MRPDNPTHVTDVNERSIAVRLPAPGGELEVTLPSNTNLVPPSYYMLFAVNPTDPLDGRLGPGSVTAGSPGRHCNARVAARWPGVLVLAVTAAASLFAVAACASAPRPHVSPPAAAAPGCTPTRPTRSSPARGHSGGRTTRPRRPSSGRSPGRRGHLGRRAAR